MDGEPAARLEHDSHGTTVTDIPAIFCRLHGLRWSDACKPSRVVPPRPPDPRAAHGRGARRPARGLGTDGAARRAGARCGGRADPLGPRSRRRVPARARLPHEAHRPRCDRGRGALRRPRCGARAWAGARRSTPEAARLAARRAAGPRRPSRTALPRRHARLVSRGGPRPPSARDRGGALARPAPRHALPRGRAPSSRAGSTRSGSSSRPACGTCSPGAAARSASTASRGSSPRRSARTRPRAPPDFDLAAAWASRSEAFERSRPQIEVTVRVPRSQVRYLRGARVVADDDRPTVVARFEGLDHAYRALLAYGSRGRGDRPDRAAHAYRRCGRARTAALYAGSSAL